MNFFLQEKISLSQKNRKKQQSTSAQDLFSVTEIALARPPSV